MEYFIIQKDGHEYRFLNYRNICIEFHEKFIINLEIQLNKRSSYKKIGIFLETIKNSNLILHFRNRKIQEQDVAISHRPYENYIDYLVKKGYLKLKEKRGNEILFRIKNSSSLQKEYVCDNSIYRGECSIITGDK